jgi:DNA-binding transcriptional MerR regulator
MAATMSQGKTYTIQQASALSGLSAGMLRYYESIGLIGPITRGISSKHRQYIDHDLEIAAVISCLHAVGMSTSNMRQFLGNRLSGATAANKQIALLETQQIYLANERQYLELREKYLILKVRYYSALSANNTDEVNKLLKQIGAVSEPIRLHKQRHF